MDSYSEREHQHAIALRLQARAPGFVRLELQGAETIPELFDRQAQLHADKPAIVSTGRVLTYSELARRSCDIGLVVARALGERKYPVVVLVAQYPTFIASMLGVLRAGGFYVPLDPNFPDERNARILSQLKSSLILTERANQSIVERFASPDQVTVYVDDIPATRETLYSRSLPDDLAYVMFTSGSTGQPKGVMQTQRNLLQVVKRYTNTMYLEPGDRYALLSSCSVTAAAGAILSSLLNGVTLLSFSVREHGLAGLADWLEAEQISIYHSVPSLFRHLMSSVSRERIFTSPRLVRLGGDSVYKSDWELFKQHFSQDTGFVQYYGCSEISSVARFYADASSRLPEGIVPAGYPLDEVAMSLAAGVGEVETPVSDSGNPMERPSGTGEIVIRSCYLSPGYWPDASHSLERLARMRTYKTGDLGTLRPEYGLVHVGREDLQVKLSGFRVEIAEIEACLRYIPGVKEAAVIVHTPTHGERVLLGFVAVDPPDSEAASRITTYLRKAMPSHMVPSEIVIMEELPFTPNGKIDRAALSALGATTGMNRPYQPEEPSSRTEAILSNIWREVLSVDRVGVDDGFFELGGNSLLGMRLAAKTSECFGVNVASHSIVQFPTIRQLAQLVDRLLPVAQPEPMTNDAEMEEGAI